MMKFLLPLISFFIGNAKSFFKEPGAALTQQLVLHIRSLTVLILSCIGSLALLCVSASLFVVSVKTQLESEEAFAFSKAMIVYGVALLLSLSVLLYASRKNTWLKALGFATSTTRNKEAPKSGALESAIALLVVDFIEERQNRRKHDGSETSASA